MPEIKSYLLFSGFLLFLMSLCGCFCSAPAQEKDYGDCLSCHKGIESMGPDHDFECGSCHLFPQDRHLPLKEHGKIVRNPSGPEHVDLFCGPCHKEEIRRTKSAIHSTMAGVINQTRYLWGAQAKAAPALYGLSGDLEPLPSPDPSVYPDEPEKLVDDFLRRRCLRCHLNEKGSQGDGLYRSGGCAACHVVYADDGRYRGKDQAIGADDKGYPSTHRFTRLIPNEQCLHCHNHNHVGADYEGLFERDFSSTFRSPPVEGKALPLRWGVGAHRLSKDVHAEKGLMCIDCHDGNDLMGDGKIYSFQMEIPKRTCADCHGDGKRPMPDVEGEGIRIISGRPRFVSKSGRTYPLPLFSKDAVGHNVQAHGRLRCSACHAQWSFQDYGLSVVREDVLQGYKWYKLAGQGDPYLEGVLEGNLSPAVKRFPFTKDRITGESKQGIWSLGWRFRRWEGMPLGVDDQGKIAVLRPLYQYLVSYVDKLGGVPLDGRAPQRGDGSGRGWAFMPYVPHTTAPFGRRCESCHLNRAAAGLGTAVEDPSPDVELTIPSPPAVEGMRLLNRQEKQALMNPSRRWQKERLNALTGD